MVVVGAVALRAEVAVAEFLVVGGETRHGADVVASEYLCVRSRRFPKIVEVVVVELLAARSARSARHVDDGREFVLLAHVEVGRELRFQGQRRDRLDFQRGGREYLGARVAAVHGFELGDGVHDVGTLDAAGHVGRRSDTAPFRFAVVSVDDVAVCVTVINRCGSGEPHGAVDGNYTHPST